MYLLPVPTRATVAGAQGGDARSWSISPFWFLWSFWPIWPIWRNYTVMAALGLQVLSSPAAANCARPALARIDAPSQYRQCDSSPVSTDVAKWERAGSSYFASNSPFPARRDAAPRVTCTRVRGTGCRVVPGGAASQFMHSPSLPSNLTPFFFRPAQCQPWARCATSGRSSASRRIPRCPRTPREVPPPRARTTRRWIADPARLDRAPAMALVTGRNSTTRNTPK